MQKKVYILEGLDCANCAAKMERELSNLPELREVSVTFATKQLRVTMEDTEGVYEKIVKIVKHFEPDVEVVERTGRRNVSTTKTHQEHQQDYHHDEGCSCGHDHRQEQHHHHEEGCGCGHNHEHHHYEESCGCGHNHEHHHHEEECGCGHDHRQEHRHDHNQKESIPIYPEQDKKITVISKDHNKKVADKRKKEQEPIWKKPLFSVFAGAALFLIGFAMIHFGGLEETDIRLLPLFLAAYLILGGEVLVTAGKNMTKGQIFDENFLMSIATLGAFAIREFPEAVGVMLFYRIGEYFEERATEKSRSQIMEAVDLRPEVVNLVIGEEIKVIDAEEAKVGDIILVRPGDRIPLDSVIVEGESRVDTSPVTGEPVPVMVAKEDHVISGCVNTSGQLMVRVEKVLEESMVTRILDAVENAAASKPNIDKFITKFARIYTPFVVFFAIAVAILLPLIFPGTWSFLIEQGDTAHSSIYMALTFLVISCPCAIVLSVPLAFFSGIGAGSKKGILFKGGITIEALKNVKAVVMDKTGTITKGNFVVQRVNLANEKMTEEQLLSMSASAEMSSTHPVGNSIVEAAKEKGIEIERPSNVEEIAGQGIRATISEGVVLCGNRKLMDANHIDLSAYKKEDSGTEVLIAFQGEFVGNIVISDTIKEDAVEAIRSVKKHGAITAMLTGDAQESADKVAKETGIDEVYAKLLPEEKLLKLQKIREKHGAVMFIGDGINDAPVLAGADVGAAMGSGADAAIEAADVVFMNSEMKAIPEALDIARMTSRISWQNVYFALFVKIIVMIAGLLGFANMWLAVFADTGVSVLCLLNSIRILRR